MKEFGLMKNRQNKKHPKTIRTGVVLRKSPRKTLLKIFLRQGQLKMKKRKKVSLSCSRKIRQVIQNHKLFKKI